MKTPAAVSVFLVPLLGCAGASRVATVDAIPVRDEPAVTAATDEQSRTAQPVASEDPVADAQALQALHQLEFNGISPDGYHITGVIPIPEEMPSTMVPLGTGAGGGPEGLAGPVYDIDVESFADNARVQYYIDYFTGNGRDRFTVWLGRMNRYEGMIRSVFRSYGIPEDMVYLALIESGYSNTAVSRVRAVGMWQFMSYAARPYGLRVDNWVDERRDPFRATDAAARHLADLYERFGSWYVSAAAYNGGIGRVSRGITRLGASDSVSDGTFFDLSDRRYIRRETRDYVPKLIAAAVIAKEPQRHGFDAIPYLAPLEFDEMTVTDATGLDVIARLADTTTAAIVELNPAFHRGATPPGENSVVRVPRGTGDMVALRFAELPAADRVNFVEHRVANGETLSEIGVRYGVSVRLLMAANPGLEPRRLRIGRVLTIPVSPAARAGETRPVVVPRASTASPARGPGVRHTVRRGESLWLIARRYGTTIDRLRERNSLVPGEVLRVGQVLVVGAAPGTHTVRRGESLWTIAQRYGVPHGSLREWNGLDADAVLRVGQVLRLGPP